MLTAFTWAAAAALAQSSSWRGDASSQGSDWTLDDESAGLGFNVEADKQDWIVSYLDHLSPWRLHFNTSCVSGGRRLGSRCFSNGKCEARSLATHWKEWKHFDWTRGISGAPMQRVILHISTSFSLHGQEPHIILVAQHDTSTVVNF